MTRLLLSDELSKLGHAPHQRDWFLIALMVSQLALMASTFRLWFGNESFSVVPLFSQLESVPLIVDHLFSTALAAAILIWLGALLRPLRLLGNRCRTGAAWTALISAVALVTLNQQRLQPWHWLFILVTTQTLLINVQYQISLRRLTLAAIYIFAGVSRLGSGVDTGMVRQLASVICEKTHLIQLQRNPETVFWICMLMTLAESATGFGLLFPATRKCAIAAAVIMHLLLLTLLSPLGLNHHAGVLLWNAFFAVGIPLLFLRNVFAELPNATQDGPTPPQNGRGAATAFAAFVILLPLCGLFGFADNWPSWQLYSPRSDVVRVYIKASAIELLPIDVQRFVGAPAALEEWCPVRIDLWSLATVNAPLYPEDRFQLAIANNLGGNLPADAIKVTIESAQLLFWKARQLKQLNGTEAMLQQSSEYQLNAFVTRR